MLKAYTSLLLLLFVLSILHSAQCQVYVPDAVEKDSPKNELPPEIIEVLRVLGTPIHFVATHKINIFLNDVQQHS